ncbi:epoxyqueuosine reductase [Anaerosporobacter sp.]|uniref:epoxyqueuosine reductase n=1 Tax=Anaerosporobacter sp. TaxID=1872529 RepID=UPI00286F2AFF|nr:epoxyqueuosine reductase [Anaerosporobacter sp.]
MLERDIAMVFQNYPDIIYAYTDIAYSEFGKEYASALVFAIPYNKRFTLHNYSEMAFEKTIVQTREVVNSLQSDLETILINHTVKYNIPPVEQKDEQSFVAPFSFKYAAVKAGLGWIGKNNILITEQYGSQQRLGVILIDYTFEEYGISKSNQCPEECNRCVDICPYHAIKGIEWHPEIKREEMIDYLLCSRQRSKFIEKHGRKSSCGLCMLMCL